MARCWVSAWIPAFAIDRNAPQDDLRSAQAWLLIYTILDQSNRAATTEGVAADPMMIEVLADSFLDFVRGTDSTACA